MATLLQELCKTQGFLWVTTCLLDQETRAAQLLSGSATHCVDYTFPGLPASLCHCCAGCTGGVGPLSSTVWAEPVVHSFSTVSLTYVEVLDLKCLAMVLDLRNNKTVEKLEIGST